MIRHIRTSDYYGIISVMNNWWGKNVAHLLPKLFFIHFQNTSFVCEEDNLIVGFIVGFISQTEKNEAYIHFVGVHPEYRKMNIAKKLHQTFCESVKAKSCKTVRCITSPMNKDSINFHRSIGFEIEDGDAELDGVPICSNYAGENQARVLFYKDL